MTRIVVCVRRFTVALLGALTACTMSDERVSWTATDSSGVSIVLSTSPLWESEGALSDVPELEVVSDESEPGSILYQVTGAALLPDRRLIVANRGDYSIRLYDSSGEPVWRAGTQGEGPGEFRDLRGIAVIGGEIWAYQSLPLPVQVFDLEGRYLRRAATPEGSGPRIRGILSNGSIVAATRERGTSVEQVFSQTSDIVTFKDGSADTIATFPSYQLVNTSVGAEVQALSPRLSVAASYDHIAAGFSAAWDITVWDHSGTLVRRIRRAWDPVAVTASHREAYGESLLAQGEALGRPQVLEAYRQLAAEMVYPSSHAAFDRIVIESSGGIWVEHPQTQPPWSEAIDYNPVRPHPSKWDIFAVDGSWLGTVTIPPGFRVMDVGEDYVVGVSKDALEVERVQVWGLRRPN